MPTLQLPAQPVIAIVGVGAVGGYYGAKLIRAGHDVHLLLRSDYQAVRAGGIRVQSEIEQGFSIPPDQLKIYRDPGDLPKPDLVLIALKATGNGAYESLIGPMLKDDTILLTIQNGLGNEDQLADLFGEERVVGGMAFVCIHRTAPGVIHHIDHGFVKVGDYIRPGRPSAQPVPRVEQIADLFRSSGVRCDVLDDLRRGRWEKLVWNIPFNGLGAVLDLATDRLLSTDAGMTLVRQLMQEAIAIAAAEGVSLPADTIERQVTHTATMGAYLSSMQVDRRAGRALEIEAILGEPLRRAQLLNIATPALATIYQMARLIDPAASM
ncbi:2-dehydropantoate 2-reductase [Humisphaera borealis]|uniref:2-dehydropantoate 2-reductase n=1 Tax=Humisphaera borealis TaxID=2807512 RepID=A0A7M2WQJ9_9BACT|nr:2-dehydropantoate 2-reductase [Humisphaera borealis]QOV87736.1 2-dehydropantoate 2-reductase [Humisphaera borealis]